MIVGDGETLLTIDAQGSEKPADWTGQITVSGTKVAVLEVRDGKPGFKFIGDRFIVPNVIY